MIKKILPNIFARCCNELVLPTPVSPQSKTGSLHCIQRAICSNSFNDDLVYTKKSLVTSLFFYQNI